MVLTIRPESSNVSVTKGVQPIVLTMCPENSKVRTTQWA